MYMRIGIDIDDTAFITVDSMIKYADKFDQEELSGKGICGNLGLIRNRYYLSALYGWDEETKMRFFKKYYRNVLEESKPMPGAIETIQKLKRDGHEIYFITARLNIIEDVRKITVQAFQKYDIPYDQLIINASDKKIHCLENHIDVFIEDSFETCQELSQEGIKTYLMTTKMNQNIEDAKVERVYNWEEVYQKISARKES